MTYTREQLLSLEPADLVDIVMALDGTVCGVARNMAVLIQRLSDVKTEEDGKALLEQSMTATAMVVQSAEEFIARKLNPDPATLN